MPESLFNNPHIQTNFSSTPTHYEQGVQNERGELGKIRVRNENEHIFFPRPCTMQAAEYANRSERSHISALRNVIRNAGTISDLGTSGNNIDCGRLLPNSCIEAAEYVVRIGAAEEGKEVHWPDQENVHQTPVYLVFKDHYVNISDTQNFHNLLHDDVNDYEFPNGLPKVGEGLGLVNKLADQDGYNMHFGGVVKTRDDGVIELTDMNERPGSSAGLDPTALRSISHVNQFRLGGYEDASYALGLLTTNIEPFGALIELTNEMDI